MTEVMRLSGQEYVDMYATKAKAASASGGSAVCCLRVRCGWSRGSARP